jgi:DNA repair exonuclease SbcCD ATPase subunit
MNREDRKILDMSSVEDIQAALLRNKDARIAELENHLAATQEFATSIKAELEQLGLSYRAELHVAAQRIAELKAVISGLLRFIAKRKIDLHAEGDCEACDTVYIARAALGGEEL